MGSQLINQEFGFLNQYLRKPASSLFSIPLPDEPGEVNQSTIDREMVKKTIAKSNCGGTSFIGNNRNNEVLKLNILPVSEKVEGALPPSINRYFQNQGKRVLYKDLREVRQRQDEKTRMVYDYFSNIAETTAKQRALSLYLAGMSVDEVAEQLKKGTSEIAQMIGSTSQNSVAQIQQLLYGDRGLPTPYEAQVRGRKNAEAELQRLDGEPGMQIRGGNDTADALRQQNTMSGVGEVDDNKEVVELNNPMMEEKPMDDEPMDEPIGGAEPESKQPEQEEMDAREDMMRQISGGDEDEGEDQLGGEQGGEIPQEVQRATTRPNNYDQVVNKAETMEYQPRPLLPITDPGILTKQEQDDILEQAISMDQKGVGAFTSEGRLLDALMNNEKFRNMSMDEKGFYEQTLREAFNEKILPKPKPTKPKPKSRVGRPELKTPKKSQDTAEDKPKSRTASGKKRGKGRPPKQ